MKWKELLRRWKWKVRGGREEREKGGQEQGESKRGRGEDSNEVKAEEGEYGVKREGRAREIGMKV